MVRVGKPACTFLLLEWETSSHKIAILGVSLIPQQIPQCVLLFGGVLPPDATILGGILFGCLGGHKAVKTIIPKEKVDETWQ